MTPVLSSKEALQRLAKWSSEMHPPYLAFYSSVLGGVVQDVAFMTIPADDHLVHRGHAVFDTALVRDGRVYQLDQHLDRFIQSAKRSLLWNEDRSPVLCNRERLKSILLDTIQTAGERHQVVRYWMGSGSGGFGISDKECHQPSFYAVCIRSSSLLLCPSHRCCIFWRDSGERVPCQVVRVMTSTVPMKPIPFPNMKTTNYLPNVMNTIEAQNQGVHTGIWVTAAGVVAEGAVSNIGFVIEGTFVVPKFDHTLEGITIQRMMKLISAQLKMPVIQRDVYVSEGKAAEEAMLFGGRSGVISITHWDDSPIGSGVIGRHAKAFLDLFYEDLKHGHGDSTQLISLLS